MKHLLYTFSLVGLFFVLFSCEDQDILGESDETNSQSLDYNLQAFVDQTEFGSVKENTFGNVMIQSNDTITTITGTNDEGYRLRMIIKEKIAVGTYSSTSNDDCEIIYASSSGSQSYSSDNGDFSITISEVNTTENTISGTFTATLTDQIGSSEDINLTTGIFTKVKIVSSQALQYGLVTFALNDTYAYCSSFSSPATLFGLQNPVFDNFNFQAYVTIDDEKYKLHFQFPNTIAVGAYSHTSTGISMKLYKIVGSTTTEYTINTSTINIITNTSGNIVGDFVCTAVNPNDATDEIEITLGNFGLYY